MRTILVLVTSLSLSVACMRGPRTIPFDPDVTFAMHQENREFVVDRPSSSTPALVTPATWFRGPRDPFWALRHDGRVLAGYWVVGDASTVARAGLDGADRPLGDVRPSWDENAIRLHIETTGGQPIQSDTFARTGGGGGPELLSRVASANIDVRGRYQAALRDASGAQVGWLRVRIGPYEAAPRVYEGVLPAGLSQELAVAMVISLASEIDWIENHAVIDVYQGDKGQLIQSYPMH